MSDPLKAEDYELVDRLVAKYNDDIELYGRLADNLRTLLETKRLRQLYHSIRWRVKDPAHLRDKLIRKIVRSKDGAAPFEITEENLFEKVTDLVGVRLLHLHTTEFPNIHEALAGLLNEDGYEILEGPEARLWDDEYRRYFQGIGVHTVESARMYTSVHYVVALTTRTRRTGEIQVRTLAEELWGEVDHTINYPHESDKLACREQIKVLARLTSTCTRLVDSIFTTDTEE
jgi:putative GTP pyrophosphokinase